MKATVKKEVRQAVGYIRVSTDKQETDAQRGAINEAAAKEGLKVSFVEETISSRKAERKVYEVVNGLKAGETLIVYEVSRLARSIGEVFELAQKVKRQKAGLWVLKPEIRIGKGESDLQSNMLLFALSTAAEIEKDLISERTKNALRARKAAGMKLGRPEGKGRKVEKAIEAAGMKAEELRKLQASGVSAAAIARLIKLDGRTVQAWLKK